MSTTLVEPRAAITNVSLEGSLVEVAIKDVETRPEESSYTTGAVYLLCGVAHLWFWNCTLNLMNGIQSNYFVDSTNISDTLTAVFETCALLGTITPTIRGALQPGNSLGFALLCAVACIGLAMTLQLGSGSAAALAMLHVCCGAAGFSVGMMESVQFGFASSMPTGVYAGHTSMGQGLCGILTFSLFMAVSRLGLRDAFLGQVWLMMGLGAGLLVVSSVTLHFHCQRPEVKQKFKSVRAAIREERTDPNAMTWLQLFLESKLMIFNVFWTFLITFLVYPNFGPLRWKMSSTGIDVGVGLFQLGDFSGRLLPLASRWVPLLLLSRRWLTGLNLAMIGFPIFSVIAWRAHSSAVFSNAGLLCFVLFIMAFCQGWYGSTALMRAPLSLQGDKAKYRPRLAAMTIVALLVGISTGLWTATLLGRSAE